MKNKYTPWYWVTKESENFFKSGYVPEGTDYKDHLYNICKKAEKILNKKGFADRFFENISKGWYLLPTPNWTSFLSDTESGISCVEGDTWINTINGGKQARDIKLGDMVLTHKNRFRKITNIIPTKDRSDIWKLKVGTRMTNLYITGNHPVLTNLGWVRVDELDPTAHLIAVNGKLNYEAIDYTINMEEFITHGYISEDNILKYKYNSKYPSVTLASNINHKISVSDELSWAIGLWFAEGSVTKNKKKLPTGVMITLNPHDEGDMANKWLDIMSRNFGVHGKVNFNEVQRNDKVSKWINVTINSTTIGNFFNSFGNGCKEKTLPLWLMNLPISKLIHFMNGIFDGDGTPQRNANSITLANPEIIMQLYQIGLKLDYDMSLQMQAKPSKLSTTKHVYVLVLRKYFNSVSKRASNAGIKFNDGLIYCPIQTLEKTNKVEDVYDFTVEEDHSFSCAGVVVHNCFNSHCGDSINDIMYTASEIGKMSQVGGGTSIYLGDVRGRGAEIKGGGKSSGAVSFIPLFEEVTNVVSQKSRRGYVNVSLPITHPDIDEFLLIRTDGYPVQKIAYTVCIDDEFMNRVYNEDSSALKLMSKVIENRFNQGFPFIMFTDNVNNQSVDVYKDKGCTVNGLNLCVASYTEILTEHGYLPIGELEDTTLDIWNGKEWSKTTVKKTGENQQLLRITTNSGYELDCTPYHKFYVQNSYWGKIEEKRAFELQKDDKLIKFDLPLIQGDNELEYAYDNGFYSGDGCITPKGQRIYLYHDKRELINLFTSISKWYYQPNQKRIYGHTYSLKDKFFVPLNGYSIVSRLNWLAGLLDSDGTVINNNGAQSLQISSTEFQFLKEVQLMLQTLGVDSKVTLCSEDGYKTLPKNDGSGEKEMYMCKTSYRLLINGNSLWKLSQLGLKCYRLKWEEHKPNRECSQFIKIEAVKKLDGFHDTFCFKEEKRGMGMFNGILTGQCQEITLPSTIDESFVCNILAMNALHYDEWKDTDAIELGVYFMDAVMTDFIEKMKKEPLMQKAVRFAENHRALGMGCSNYHYLLLDKGYAWESKEARELNVELFHTIQNQAHAASEKMALEHGKPEMLKEAKYKRRHTTLTAVAPNTSSQTIIGNGSCGIEPLMNNFYVKTLAKDKIEIKNPFLEQLLEQKGKNNDDVWSSILMYKGSVQHLDFLTKEEKKLFKTFKEISQLEILQHAADRQLYIDQSQSLNLALPSDTTDGDSFELIYKAWRMGIKSLYYQLNFSAAMEFNQSLATCEACAG